MPRERLDPVLSLAGQHAFRSKEILRSLQFIVISVLLPRALAGTRAWDYSIFNLTAYLNQAAVGVRVNVDLWTYQTSDGRSLRKGVGYLVPFATGAARFPYKQVTPFRASELHAILRRAAVGWNDPKYRTLAQEIGGGTAMLDLTFP